MGHCQRHSKIQLVQFRNLAPFLVPSRLSKVLIRCDTGVLSAIDMALHIFAFLYDKNFGDSGKIIEYL